jgi:2-C-methyl-D-erythritol 2,4-cyclodiphosphate synthase
VNGERPTIRIGLGFDTHPFDTERPLILGGVEIPFAVGLSGYSDADVVTHAIIDALLGAAGAGDIGEHFPDTDERYKGISSLELLAEVKKLLDKEGYSVVNIDAVVVLEEPKLGKFRNQMILSLAKILEVPENCLSIKATTTEGLGFTGRGEGIAAQAVALIEKR